MTWSLPHGAAALLLDHCTSLLRGQPAKSAAGTDAIRVRETASVARLGQGNKTVTTGKGAIPVTLPQKCCACLEAPDRTSANGPLDGDVPPNHQSGAFGAVGAAGFRLFRWGGGTPFLSVDLRVNATIGVDGTRSLSGGVGLLNLEP